MQGNLIETQLGRGSAVMAASPAHRRDAAPVREDIFEIGSEGLSVTELSQKLALPTGEVVKTLFMQGIMVQVNQVCLMALAASVCCC